MYFTFHMMYFCTVQGKGFKI